MNYKDWIELRRLTTKENPQDDYFSATYENKEVRVSSYKDAINICWYIDGQYIKNADFPIEKVKEIELFAQTLLFTVNDKHTLFKVLHTMERYLPYLKDGDKKEDECLKYVKIKGEIKL